MEQEIKRLKKHLSETNPASKDYEIILTNLKAVFWFDYDMERVKAQCVDALAERKCVTTAPSSVDDIKTVLTEQTSTPEPTPMAEPVPAPVVEPEPVKEEVKPKSKSKPKKDTEADTSTITKETVRALLSEASKNGVQIQPIVAKFVPEGKPVKFSEIPSSSYPDVIEEIKNAR